jgi:hypothetical protein
MFCPPKLIIFADFPVVTAENYTAVESNMDLFSWWLFFARVYGNDLNAWVQRLR